MNNTHKKLLGIDYGTKRIGLALSDEGATLAFPHGVITTTKDALDTIKQTIAEEGVGEIVIGESKDFSGEENPVMEEIKVFKEKLETETSLPVYYEEEYLTSVQAARHEGNRENLDASAAALILQSFIDSRSQENL